MKKRDEPSATVQSYGSYLYPANSVVADTSGLAHLAPWRQEIEKVGFLDQGLGFALFFPPTKSDLIFRNLYLGVLNMFTMCAEFSELEGHSFPS